MIYYVIELQSNDSGAALCYSFNNKEDAEIKFHEVCMYAVKSNVRNHSIMLCDENMSFIMGNTYSHEQDNEEPTLKEGEE